VSDKDKESHRPATKLVEAGRRPEWTGAVVNPPVWRASTHIYASEADRQAALKSNFDGQFYYGRRGAPTQWALAEALTEIEPGAYGTMLYPSGVAAITGALLSVLRHGDLVLISDNSYEPTRNIARGLLKRLGIAHRFFDPREIDAYRAMFADKPRAVWLESPGSLTMEVCDAPLLSTIAREHDAVSLLDNTWASPLGFAALEHGCDISVMSLSKHVGGHSDLMMGSASAGERWYRRLRQTSQQLGQVVSPDDAALALRGLRTLGVRLEQSTRSAIEVAQWLSARPEVAHVMCPLLPGDSGHEIWKRDFNGGCGLFSFILNGADQDARARLVDNLDLFGIGYSWGGFESLALPFDPQPMRDCIAWPPPGVDGDKGLGVRLSIGLEDPADLIADLERGFAAMRGK
jgi:cystathionine beta-lyase